MMPHSRIIGEELGESEGKYRVKASIIGEINSETIIQKGDYLIGRYGVLRELSA